MAEIPVGVFPVRAYQGRRPVISQGRKPGHNGVDVMFRFAPGDPFKLGTPNASKDGGDPGGDPDFVMPDGIEVVAAFPGTVRRTGNTGRGDFVDIMHDGFATFSTHMRNLKVKAGDKVRAGQVIGIVGFSPQDAEKLMHLHFEIWDGGDFQKHLDPQAHGIDTWPLSAPEDDLKKTALGAFLAWFGATFLGRWLSK